ncbi:Oidioi.mRNA.OKI2018_I69.chr1.g2281.t1.cds [Oikopleura dioica]|uniref:Oidioi.mRNA.OKI2018_I69.chr1.g2281.t1.cds n=1 Tax=Oikopleura dioica TaxID=34765 RepID=A0ABN7SSC6_OIKDI|nr:Oidioi.mRNA.OKI2018_I69.chr1.g2281.t1.cds [Oikopleura dioica]
MVKLTPLVGLISFTCANSIDIDVIKNLRAIENYERANGPMSFEEVLLRAESQGFDLKALLEERGITREDIEEAKDNAHLNGDDLNGDGFIDDFEEEQAADPFFEEFDILSPGNNFHMMQKSKKFDDLQSTIGAIMNLILPRPTDPPRTRPPMPWEATTETPPTPEWDNWKEWQSCSKSCGTGVQKRFRVCRNSQYGECSGNARQQRHCNKHDCVGSEWAPWNPWTPCSKSCNNGMQIRNRVCNRVNGAPCKVLNGVKNMQFDNCNTQSCFANQSKWTNWGSWSQCGKSCDGGFRIRQRVCLRDAGSPNCPGSNVDSERCNTEPCKKVSGPIGEWTQWSSCNKTCGIGKKTRTRTCSYSPGRCRRFKLEDEQQCFAGVKTRIRKCIGGVPGVGGCNGSYEDSMGCNVQGCPEWNSWSDWSGCSRTCGGGLSRRSRYCRNGTGCPGESYEEKVCQTDSCPSWNQWGSWSTCDAECDGGFRERKRSCENGKPGQRGCFGEYHVKAKCNTRACPRWENWAEWSECSVSCGVGKKYRYRYCNNEGECSGDDTDSAQCFAGKCAQWQNWGSWSACSVTCGSGGNQKRYRECVGKGECKADPYTNDLDSQFQFCREASMCPSWEDWSRWSSCSATCGGGSSQRSRACNVPGKCNGLSTQRKDCNEESCPVPSSWKSWSNWSPCSASCGGGSRSRSRSCSGNSCSGKGVDSESCNTFECATLEPWGTWAACNCASNRQKRTRHCSRPDPRSKCPDNHEEFRSCACSTRAPPRTFTEAQTTTTSSDEMLGDHADELNKLKGENEDEDVCTLLNVNGDCLDHLEYDKGDKIVDIHSCDLPAYIIKNSEVIGTAEMVKGTATKVKYSCVENYKIRGNRIVECRCRGTRCRTKPKNLPMCAPAVIHLESASTATSTTPISTRSTTYSYTYSYTTEYD